MQHSIGSLAASLLARMEQLPYGNGDRSSPPRAEAGGPYRWTAGRPVRFDGSASSAGLDGRLTYSWDFGDGATGEAAVVAHTYAAPGVFTARLTVTDSEGRTASAITGVTIVAPRPTSAVVWEAVVGAEADRNNLRKVAGAAVPDAGAVSRQALMAADGFVEFEAAETDTDRVAGLGRRDTGPGAEDIDFGIHLQPDGTATILEAGRARGPRVRYAAGDRQRVWLDNGIVRYVLEGRVLGAASLLLPAGAPMTLPAEPDSGWRIAATGDFDGDHHTDIVWRNVTLGSNRVWLMNGARLLRVAELPAEPDPEWTIVAATDFDKDGRPDLLWHHSSGKSRVWLMDGLTLTTEAALDAEPDPGWRLAAAGDLDGDGDADLVWRRAADGRNRVWLMEGFIRTESVELDLEPDPAWEIVGLSRFGLDSQPDLLWVNTKTGAARVWILDGWQKLVAVELDHAGDRPQMAVAGAGDFNGDGQADVLRRDRRNGSLGVDLLDGRPPLPLRADTSLVSAGASITRAVMTSFGGNPPVADPGGPYRWVVGEPIEFDGTGSKDDDGEIVRYQWSFGDGSEAEGPTPVHSYAAPGRFTVTLTVTDNSDASGSSSTFATTSIYVVHPAGWSKPVKVTMNANNLLKEGRAGWNAGAATHQELAGGDGYVEFTALETNTRRAAGFGQDDPSATLEDLEFGMLLSSSGMVQAVESGSPVGTAVGYHSGDRLRVFVDSGVVQYVRNGRVLAISGREPVFPLRMDTALYSQGATIASAFVAGEQVVVRNAPPTVSLAGAGCHVPCTATFTASALDPDGDPVTYTWGGCATNGGGGASATCPLPVMGTVTATVQASDAYGGSANASAQATGTNAPPQVAIGGELVCHPPCTAHLLATASDPDGDPLTLTWGGCAAGQTGASASCTFAGIPPNPPPVEHAVTALVPVSFAALQGHAAGCTGPSAVDTPSCRAAAFRFCRAQPAAYSGGFGPVEYDATNALVVCAGGPFGAVPASSFAELATFHPGCSAPEGAMSGACAAATHRYCVAHGHGSGFGPVEFDSTVAYPYCARSGTVRVVQATFGELQQHFPTCTAAAAATSPCHVAANRYCRASGYGGGFGPVEYTADTASVACMPVRARLGSADVSVTAEDGRGSAATDIRSITLRNAAPGVTVTVQPATCHAPCRPTFTALASDADGDPLSYTWTGCANGQVGPTAACDMPVAGTYTTQVEVRDPLGASATASAQAVATNQGPTVSLSSHRSCHPACSATFTATANDPDGDPLDLRWSGCAAGQVGPEAICAFPELPAAPPAIAAAGARIVQTTFSALNAKFEGCTGPLAAPSVVCQAAAHRLCVAAGYAGGYGPVEYTTAQAPVFVTCLGADLAAVEVTTFQSTPPQPPGLATHHPGCNSAAVAATNACAVAVHRYCVSRGYGSGVGPLEFSGNSAYALCVEPGIARAVDTTFAVLQTHFDTCQAGLTAQSACRRAVSRFCQARGQGGGFGPVESNGPAASVACMPATTMRVVVPVSVVADDLRGGQASAAATVQVADGVATQVLVVPDPPSCAVPCTIAFNAAALDPDGDPLVLSWGDCALGQVGSRATCEATAPGTLVASVEAIDGRGGVVTGQAQATASAPTQNAAPVANAGGPYHAVAAKPLTLDGRASRDPEGRPLTYAWAFGDAGSGTGPTPIHVYAQPGTYTVTLTVRDDHDTPASTTATVTVDPNDDQDGDGLPGSLELVLGSNPDDADTNHDGLPDGAAYALGLSLTDPDMDHDGLANAAEILAGTDPFNADTDGDGVSDALDAFPLDPTRQNPQPTPGDQTPPTIQLTKPETATPHQ